MSLSASVKPFRLAVPVAPASACTRARFTRRLTIESCDMHSRPAPSCHEALLKRSSPDLPLGGDHPMHPFIIDAEGSMYVDVATATNACQLKNRQLKSPGANPCTELGTRGGVWRYNANKTNQTFSPAARYATGIRNAEGFAVDSAGRVFVTQHGRDQLHANWPDLYKPSEEATLPAEELLLLKSGGDYGWPECYYDASAEKISACSGIWRRRRQEGGCLRD